MIYFINGWIICRDQAHPFSLVRLFSGQWSINPPACVSRKWCRSGELLLLKLELSIESGQDSFHTFLSVPELWEMRGYGDWQSESKNFGTWFPFTCKMLWFLYHIRFLCKIYFGWSLVLLQLLRRGWQKTRSCSNCWFQVLLLFHLSQIIQRFSILP